MNQEDVDRLKESLAGYIILPGDADYDQASTTIMAKGAPAIVVRPHTAQDVATALAFARQHGIKPLSVKSGGHSNSGHSTNTGGIVIDLVDMNNVELIDADKHIVRIGGGAIWAHIAEELEKHGLAISSGDTKTVGVGGLTLGGGIGWMVRKYGLALDNLVAAEVVAANGDIVRASEDEHADLFWAIRGGGGNFGVVTSFEMAAHPTRNVYAGTITYSFDDLQVVLKGWRDYMRTAPEELTTMLMTLPSSPAFGDQPAMAIIMACYAGDDKEAALHAIDPLKQLGKVLNEDVIEKKYVDVLEDAHVPQGIKVVVNNAFFPEFSDEMIDTIVSNPNQILQIRSLGGAMNRVAPDATAFAHRKSEVMIVAPVFLPGGATEADVEAALNPWRTLSATADGSYVNFFSEATPQHVLSSYPEATYQRLAQIKAIYDPENIFNQNYNIQPKE